MKRTPSTRCLLPPFKSGFGKSRSKVSFAFRSGQVTAKRIRRGLSSRERLNSSGRGGGRGAGRVEKGKNVDEET